MASEVFTIEAPARGVVLDAVFVPDRGSRGGTFLCEFDHGVVKEFQSREGLVLTTDALVGLWPGEVPRAITDATRRSLAAEEARERRLSLGRQGPGPGGSFWRQ